MKAVGVLAVLGAAVAFVRCAGESVSAPADDNGEAGSAREAFDEYIGGTPRAEIVDPQLRVLMFESANENLDPEEARLEDFEDFVFRLGDAYLSTPEDDASEKRLAFNVDLIGYGKENSEVFVHCSGMIAQKPLSVEWEIVQPLDDCESGRD